ncbi:hypothetical protein C8Q76DRAFT_799717 [Earliella scabrosa]|nr:hypothetical protein C8Q76DRAFT_799717 [Earliella scabrosa]
MPTIHTTMCATFAAAYITICSIILSAMWDSFVNSPAILRLYADGLGEYVSPSTVGFVLPANSSEVLFCAVVDEGALPSVLYQSVESFTELVGMNDNSMGLVNDRGIVCLEFGSKEKLLAFVNAFYTSLSLNATGVPVNEHAPAPNVTRDRDLDEASSSDDDSHVDDFDGASSDGTDDCAVSPCVSDDEDLILAAAELMEMSDDDQDEGDIDDLDLDSDCESLFQDTFPPCKISSPYCILTL